MLKFKTIRDYRQAKYDMPGGHWWTFRIVEHDYYCELMIYDASGHRRRMCKETFETPSQAVAAANEFVSTWLAPI